MDIYIKLKWSQIRVSKKINKKTQFRTHSMAAPHYDWESKAHELRLKCCLVLPHVVSHSFIHTRRQLRYCKWSIVWKDFKNELVESGNNLNCWTWNIAQEFALQFQLGFILISPSSPRHSKCLANNFIDETFIYMFVCVCVRGWAGVCTLR